MMSVVKPRTLRGIIREDKIRNEYVRDRLGVVHEMRLLQVKMVWTYWEERQVKGIKIKGIKN